MKLLVMFAVLAAHVLAEAPKVNVVQATTVTCTFLGSDPKCRPMAVVLIESKTPNDKFLVGIRYLAKDGTEMIETRFPVSGASALFYFSDDVTLLSATVSSFKTNEVGLWQQARPEPPTN